MEAYKDMEMNRKECCCCDLEIPSRAVSSRKHVQPHAPPGVKLPKCSAPIGTHIRREMRREASRILTEMPKAWPMCGHVVAGAGSGGSGKRINRSTFLGCLPRR